MNRTNNVLELTNAIKVIEKFAASHNFISYDALKSFWVEDENHVNKILRIMIAIRMIREYNAEK